MNDIEEQKKELNQILDNVIDIRIIKTLLGIAKQMVEITKKATN